MLKRPLPTGSRLLSSWGGLELPFSNGPILRTAFPKRNGHLLACFLQCASATTCLQSPLQATPPGIGQVFLLQLDITVTFCSVSSRSTFASVSVEIPITVSSEDERRPHTSSRRVVPSCCARSSVNVVPWSMLHSSSFLADSP
jgi:hypothetical protein